MTERERWGLRGPVQFCRLERTWYSHRGERGDTIMLEFREDGALNRSTHHNPDGSTWITTFEYDPAGRITAVRTGSGGAAVEIHVYEYDASGRLHRVLARPQDGPARIIESDEYPVAGGRSVTRYLDVTAQGPHTNYAWSVEGTDSAYPAAGAAASTTLYNQRDQPEALLFHDAANRLLSRVEFRYDETGRLVEEAETNAAESLPPGIVASLNQAQRETFLSLLGAGVASIQRWHRYDGEGRRVETRTRIGPLGGGRKMVDYNAHGDPVLEVCQEESREHGIDEEGRLVAAPVPEHVCRSEARFRYDYDEHGNWVSKIVETRGHADQSFALASLERRAITYSSPG